MQRLRALSLPNPGRKRIMSSKTLFLGSMGFWSQYSLKKFILNSFLVGLIGIPHLFLTCNNCFNDPKVAAISLSFSSLMWIFLWQGNGLLSDYLTYRFSWLENPGKRFIFGVLGVLVYTPAAVFGLHSLYTTLFRLSLTGINSIIYISIGITFIISFFLNAWHFLTNWRKSALETAELKKEQMATKYESLKNQVNPHFLFNSLNALTNLVYEDQDQAAKFIRQLSKVYRYVLDTQSKEVVSLQTELDFLESYIFLQKIRFDEKLRVNIDVAGYEQTMLPPIAIQMLFENAIKHNTVAEEEPLIIDVSIEDEKYIVVKNNLQKKSIPVEASSGMGLANIKSRYEFLSQLSVEILETQTEFIVKLPLISPLK